MELTTERREKLNDHLRNLFTNEFDIPISSFQADIVIDSMLTTFAPEVYNQAVQDVRGYFQTKVDDLDGEVYLDTKL